MSSDGNYYYQKALEEQRQRDEEDRKNREYEEARRREYDAQIARIAADAAAQAARYGSQYAWR